MKLLLIAHGGYAIGAKEALTMIAGELNHVETLSLTAEESCENFGRRLDSYLEANKNESVLVFIDLFGGTPSNETFKAMARHKNVLALTGFNMPMLLDAAFLTMHQDLTTEDVKRIIEIGQTGMMDLNERYNEVFNQNTEITESGEEDDF